MKKLFLCILFISLTIFSVSANNSFDLKSPEVLSTRHLGLGGFYTSDTNSYFSYWINPANAALTGNRFLFPSVTINTKGNLEQIPVIIGSLTNSSEEESGSMDSILNALSSSENINIGTSINGPLCFGAIKNNFAWGIFNRTYILAEIPSVSTSNIYAGEELCGKIAYGYPIKLSGVTLALGMGATGFMQIEGFYNNAITELSSFNFATMPLYTNLGFGLDIGATLDLFKILKLSVVWDNFFQKTLIIKNNSFKEIFKMKNKDKEIESLTPYIKVGLAFNIPTKKITKGFITSWDLFIDNHDLLNFVDFIKDNRNPLKQNCLLDFSAGTELVIFNTLCFRFGISESYWAAGFGMKLGYLNLDYAIYGEELSLEPGITPVLNMSFGITIQK